MQVDFLGFHSYLSETGKVIRKLRRDSKVRIKRKAGKFNRLYAADAINLAAVRASLFSWLGHAHTVSPITCSGPFLKSSNCSANL
jgi:RNA-directed DNA polymerase